MADLYKRLEMGQTRGAKCTNERMFLHYHCSFSRKKTGLWDSATRETNEPELSQGRGFPMLQAMTLKLLNWRLNCENNT